MANLATSVADATGEEERGILLSLFILGAEVAILDRLDERRHQACAEAWHELHDLDQETRNQIFDAWTQEAASVLPRGLERLHPSWIAEALAGEPVHLVRAVQPGLPEPVRAFVETLLSSAGQDALKSNSSKSPSATATREVERLAFGWLAPLCESACGLLAESLCGLAFDELLTEVTRRGARAVGRSLAGATPALRARAMVAAGGPWAKTIGEASLENTSSEARSAAAALANTMIPASARTPAERLLHIGLAALQSELAAEQAGSLFRVAGRLPAPLGRPMIGW